MLDEISNIRTGLDDAVHNKDVSVDIVMQYLIYYLGKRTADTVIDNMGIVEQRELISVAHQRFDDDDEPLADRLKDRDTLKSIIQNSHTHYYRKLSVYFSDVRPVSSSDLEELLHDLDIVFTSDSLVDHIKYLLDARHHLDIDNRIGWSITTLSLYRGEAFWEALSAQDYYPHGEFVDDVVERAKRAVTKWQHTQSPDLTVTKGIEDFNDYVQEINDLEGNDHVPYWKEKLTSNGAINRYLKGVKMYTSIVY